MHLAGYGHTSRSEVTIAAVPDRPFRRTALGRRRTQALGHL